MAAYDYEDYGATTQIAGDAGVYNPYRYTGQEWDAELGMYNLRARHYSPSLGRFLARDPIGYGGGTNLVAYCQADPIDYADPSGLRPTELNFAIKSAPKDFDFSLLFNDLAGQTGLKVTYQFVSGGNYTGSHPSDSSTVRGLIQFDDKVVESMDQNGQLAGYQLGATLGRASHIHRGSLALFTAFRKSDFEAGIAYWMGTGLSRHQADCKARYYLTTNAILHEIIHIITGINDIDWNNMKTDLNYPWFTTSKPYTEIGKINASFLGAIK